MVTCQASSQAARSSMSATSVGDRFRLIGCGPVEPLELFRRELQGRGLDCCEVEIGFRSEFPAFSVDPPREIRGGIVVFDIVGIMLDQEVREQIRIGFRIAVSVFGEYHQGCLRVGVTW